MKKILAIFMMLIIAHPSLWGQESIKKNPTIDSLETLLQTVKAPREKIKIWDQLSRYYQEIDFDQAIGYAHKMLDYAQKEKDDTLWIKAQQAIGYSSIYKGEIEKALSLFQEAIQRSQKIDSPKFIAHGNFSLAFYHYYQGDMNQARALFQKAGQGYEQLAMWRRMAEAHNAVAVTYASQSEFKKALESFQQVLEAN
ncbi:MAG: tetratricopeptide repeat protein, partial [Bacteroidota bacterium]